MRCPVCFGKNIDVLTLLTSTAFSGIQCRSCHAKIALRPTICWAIALRVLLVFSLLFLVYLNISSILVSAALAFYVGIGIFAPFLNDSLLMEAGAKENKREIILVVSMSIFVIAYLIYIFL